MVAHNEKGVSLIEALITLAILSLSIAAVMELAGSTSNTNRYARRTTSAVHLAQDKYEELRGLGYAAVISGSDGPFTQERKTDALGAFYTRSWVVDDDSPSAGMKSVVLTINWADKDKARSASFHSYF